MPTADKTHTFSADNIGDPEPVQAQTRTHRITLLGPSTTGFFLRKPSKTSPAVPYLAGSEVIISTEHPNVYWEKNDVAAYVETEAGVATFGQVED